MSSIRLTDASPFWVSRQATWYGSTAETSKPSDPRRSWITDTLDHFQLLKWFPHMLPDSVYQIEDPPPPFELDDSNEYEVQRVLDSKIDCCKKGLGLVYLVEWSGFDNTAEP